MSHGQTFRMPFWADDVADHHWPLTWAPRTIALASLLSCDTHVSLRRNHFMSKDFEQVAKAPNEAGSKSPRPARRNGKDILRPGRSPTLKAVANMQYYQEIGATNG